VTLPTSAPDQALLARAREGDAPALEELLERHQQKVYRFGLRMCRDPEDAKDVLQDTLLALARGVRELRGTSSISTWLYTVARSFCIKRHRRGKFDPVEEHSPDEAERLPDPVALPDEALVGKQVEQALETAIRSLDPMYREVMLLRDVEGLTAPEVAEVLNLTPQAVKSRLHRARLAVRAQVAPTLGIPLEAPAAPGTCPDVLMLWSQHIEGEVSADLCARMQQHLDACPRCQSACDTLKRTLALCETSAPQVTVPSEVQAAVKAALRSFVATR
jgi:RNA polymerase sigma-70 factor (ECF subfamily)